MSIESVMPFRHLILSSISPAFSLSQHQGLSNDSVLYIRWLKYWCFSFSISPSNEYSGLIFFRIDWLYLLAIQRTLKSLLQQHSSKASILQQSAFFVVQLSHPYMTTGNTISLTRWKFVGKVMSLLFNMLSRLDIDFLPRSKCRLISWSQSLPAVILKWSEVKSLNRVQLFASPWTVAYRTPLSMGFSRQEYWSGLPFPSPGELPDPGIEPRSPALQADALTSEPPGKRSP